MSLRPAIVRSPFFLLACATSALFVGAAFVYMANKSPYFWGGLFIPGLALLVVFAAAAILSVLSLLSPAGAEIQARGMFAEESRIWPEMSGRGRV